MQVTVGDFTSEPFKNPELKGYLEIKFLGSPVGFIRLHDSGTRATINRNPPSGGRSVAVGSVLSSVGPVSIETCLDLFISRTSDLDVIWRRQVCAMRRVAT